MWPTVESAAWLKAPVLEMETRGSQSEIPGWTVSASPGNLEMQISQPHLKSTESEIQ